MRLRVALSLLVVAVCAGWGANDILKGKRLLIVTDAGEPAIVQRTDSAGAGELIINDVNGRECFAVRGGQIVCASLEQRLKAIELTVAGSSGSSSASPVIAASQPGTVPNGRVITIKFPAERPPSNRVKVELVKELARPASDDGIVTVEATFRITNISGRDLKNLDLASVVDGRDGPRVFYGLLLAGYSTTETHVIRTVTGSLADFFVVDQTRDEGSRPAPRPIQKP